MKIAAQFERLKALLVLHLARRLISSIDGLP